MTTRWLRFGSSLRSRLLREQIAKALINKGKRPLVALGRYTEALATFNHFLAPLLLVCRKTRICASRSRWRFSGRGGCSLRSTGLRRGSQSTETCFSLRLGD